MSQPTRRRATEPETEAPAEAASAKTEGYVEYVGVPPYGTEFEDARIISKKDAKDGWDIDIPKELRWTKDRRGKMRIPLSEVTSEALELLRDEPGFKVVESTEG